MIVLLDITPGLSQKRVAGALGWHHADSGEPNKRKAQTALDSLRNARLVELGLRGDGWQLTRKGKDLAKQLREAA